MRINLTSGSQPAAELNRTNARDSAVSSRASTTSALGEDQAQLSGAHIQVEALAAQAAQLPEIREQRVQELRHAVESGHYRPSADQVAGAVFAHMIVEPA
jgi:flagellar biosynthesis anti-sigma factor FlgM